MHPDFAFVDELVPGIRWDAKYATWDNFTGQPVDGYAANRISPIVGGLALSAAILNHVRHRPWGALAASGLGFLSVSGLWALITHFAGVSL